VRVYCLSLCLKVLKKNTKISFPSREWNPSFFQPWSKCRNVLQGSWRSFHQTVINFWLIIGALCYRRRLLTRHTGIRILTYPSPPHFQMTKWKLKAKLSGVSPFLTNQQHTTVKKRKPCAVTTAKQPGATEKYVLLNRPVKYLAVLYVPHFKYLNLSFRIPLTSCSYLAGLTHT
jgi:hypothetical protein